MGTNFIEDCDDCIHWDEKWQECKILNPSLECCDYESNPQSKRELEKLHTKELIKLKSWNQMIK